MSANRHDERIAREEREWTAPKLFVLGFGFLGVCLAVIFLMAYSSDPPPYHIIPWW